MDKAHLNKIKEAFAKSAEEFAKLVEQEGLLRSGGASKVREGFVVEEALASRFAMVVDSFCICGPAESKSLDSQLRTECFILEVVEIQGAMDVPGCIPQFLMQLCGKQLSILEFAAWAGAEAVASVFYSDFDRVKTQLILFHYSAAIARALGIESRAEDRARPSPAKRLKLSQSIT